MSVGMEKYFSPAKEAPRQGKVRGGRNMKNQGHAGLTAAKDPLHTNVHKTTNSMHGSHSKVKVPKKRIGHAVDHHENAKEAVLTGEDLVKSTMAAKGRDPNAPHPSPYLAHHQGSEKTEGWYAGKASTLIAGRVETPPEQVAARNRQNVAKTNIFPRQDEHVKTFDGATKKFVNETPAGGNIISWDPEDHSRKPSRPTRGAERLEFENPDYMPDANRYQSATKADFNWPDEVDSVDKVAAASNSRANQRPNSRFQSTYNSGSGAGNGKFVPAATKAPQSSATPASRGSLDERPGSNESRESAAFTMTVTDSAMGATDDPFA